MSARHRGALSASGARGGGAVRRDALRSLRISVGAHRPDHAGRPRAPSVERRSLAAAHARWTTRSAAPKRIYCRTSTCTPGTASIGGPPGLATANYQDPMLGDMLWVYEGLTEYLGDVLAVRSGLLTERGIPRRTAPRRRARCNRTARANGARCRTPPSPRSSSTTNRAIGPRGCGARRTSIRNRRCCWLEADTLIRQLSKGHKSLDDFCKLFYGPPSTGPKMVPYDLRRRGAGAQRRAALRLGRFLEGTARIVCGRGPARGTAGRRLAARP